MKIRNGFISNSSSSSFIIRKSVLTKEQEQELKIIFKKHEDNYNTSIKENPQFFEGYLEAHNALDEEGYDEPLSDIIESLMDKWKIKTFKDYNIQYEDEAYLEETIGNINFKEYK